MDESCITGEAYPNTKELIQNDLSYSNTFIYSGSKVVEGSGRLIVGAVGSNKHDRNIQQIIQEKPPSYLQRKLDRLAKNIRYRGLPPVIFVFVLLLGHQISTRIKEDVRNFIKKDLLQKKYFFCC